MTSWTNSLSIDIETYCSVSLKEVGVYKYSESEDFEILLLAYSLNGQDVQVVDLAQGEKIPPAILSLLEDETCIKYAYNAQFERVCLSRFLGYPLDKFLDPKQWRCTRVMGAYLGLPMSLDETAKVLNTEVQKMHEGKDLIKYFCVPQKPYKTNGYRTRNYYYHDCEAWETFKTYNKFDVMTERSIKDRLKKYPVPEAVWEEYVLDQLINDRGVKIDIDLVKKAIEINDISSYELSKTMKEISALDNPNSVSQLKTWLATFGISVDELGKKKAKELMLENAHTEVEEIMKLRLQLGKTSIAKYKKMLEAVCFDGRVRGMFQFYGANRTGRFSSKIVQLQNLPQNHIEELDEARDILKSSDYWSIKKKYEDVPDYLSQLVRTSFIAKPGHKFIVCDFSAIEARVLAWLSGEEWRNKAFARNADIYVASASAMLHIAESSVNADIRKKGKISELALGYGGAIGALTAMGALEMGLKQEELQPLVQAWRKSNPHIVAFWHDVDEAIRKVISIGSTSSYPAEKSVRGIKFTYKKGCLFITLPSGRNLTYVKPHIGEGHNGIECIKYYGIDVTKKWGIVESYGPKFVENITQAIARDLLCEAFRNLKDFDIVMHIHDEVVVEVPSETSIEDIRTRMIQTPKWAEGLLLNASGFENSFYKKD